MDNLEKTERAIKNGQSGERGNIGYTRRRQTKLKHYSIFLIYCTIEASGGDIEKRDYFTWKAEYKNYPG